ncbi:MAG: T9SS type A sorting domain-containing protein [Crocinitomicaceae bacterium]|nr:T9SS type A sorting domain-containing protein [Crocinitomicaceae bacterium]
MSLFGSPFVLGYATPPADLPHWPAGSTDGLSDGVVIQYEAFGSNNPNPLDLGTGAIDVLGRTATHEIGHYLGLRHIWGDGDCTAEDGIDDTPNAAAESSQDCNFSSNTCVDNIGVLGDLPDMVENYMDYSAESCQNSFTQGQVDMMRNIIEVYRFDLIDGNPAFGIEEENQNHFSVYPNPANGNVMITNLQSETIQISIVTETGQLVQTMLLSGNDELSVEGLTAGIYFISFQSENTSEVKKLIVL